ncbi:IclR family transcriptional regulator (plasmid) [Haloferax mediterranei ATCC 33500]|uniref:Transcriptional regulator n=1 Tax=Haloferax mediterranei (strain ATCC 33500 / DSM 1411 / JCM 8866 / NBRC 14739 / NCIMB 2177 / R-4) TaxID=523841 RepID=I3R9G1_HALMT|nr:IclR family transcriptional regulator [Haloferax mediterranei]AFK20871.1 transcriptional regulator [Haloferax mediterranei ATCC 33500]AHZ24260.1 transcriptional regulator [Haloferax mediterranei ATCC 33500]EMA05339.1 transcriptional regulator [Haloferax mediterranei ATCC 33500]MDX5989858.1 IclR family transcriptional regulator [Haloferax mediterranei ATCC 33500]QCQ77299.1 IclR family transcriptional regulator [Haloferax mediterranei ATCC 33500]
MTDRSQVPTLSAPKKTFALIEEMADRDGPVRVSDLAEELGFTRSTTYKHLATLRELGYVRKVGVEYALSYRFVLFGTRIRGRSPLYRASNELIDQLAETTNETTGLLVKQGSYGVNLYQSTSDRSETVEIDQHLHCTAPGKAILAHLTDEQVDHVVDAVGLPARTDNTITDPGVLADELTNVRERGIAIERGEQHPDQNGVAVAFEHDNEVAAVYVVGHADRLSSKRLEENIPGMVLGTVRRTKELL